MLERCPMRSVLAQVFGMPFEIAEQTSQEAEQTRSAPGNGPRTEVRDAVNRRPADQWAFTSRRNAACAKKALHPVGLALTGVRGLRRQIVFRRAHIPRVPVSI